MHVLLSFRTFCVTIMGSLIAMASLDAQQMTPLRQLNTLDGYIEQVRRDWGIPGLAVAIVVDDSVVYQKGFGKRELEKDSPVDAQTLFAIGSNTKAFTAAAIATLVDDGKMRWDATIDTYLPSFQVRDDYVTRHLTVRDALAHRTGLERNDMLWYAGAYDRAELVRRLRFASPAGEFRAQFGYNNLMYLTVGQASAAAAGRSWDDLITQRLFVPLGMTASSTSARALGDGNVAAPYLRANGRSERVRVKNIDHIAPAGSIVSNVRDMAQWIRMQLGAGVYRGQRIISERNIREMRTPHIPMQTVPGEALPPLFAAYGMGWIIQEYRGQQMVWHNGGIDGYMSEMRLLPAQKVGWVILTNSFGNNPMPAISYRIADLFLTVPPRDWNTEMLTAARGQEARQSSTARSREVRVTGTSPSLPLTKYAGTYSDSLYGDLVIGLHGDTLGVQFGSFTGRLTHWHYDTFRVKWDAASAGANRGDAFATFTLDAAGAPRDVTISGITTFSAASLRTGRPSLPSR